MTMALPSIPSLPAGHIATQAEMNQLAYGCTFLLTKPMVRSRDGTGGATIPTTLVNISFNNKDFDTDSMWAAGFPTLLSIQTAGWYKVRYTVNTTTSSLANPVNTGAYQITGANNPQGNNVTIGPHWAGYTLSTSQSGAAGATGIWPFYLYQGDVMVIKAYSGAATGTTTSTSNEGSTFCLEWVSM